MSEIVETNISQRLDQLEVALLNDFPAIDCPVDHIFTPGMYSRTIFMQEDAVIVSRIHNTTHQFVLSAGTVAIKTNDGEWEIFSAPYIGITKPGTRRTLCCVEDCLFTTFHPTNISPENNTKESILKAVDLVDEQILEKHINPILGGELKNNIVSQQTINQ